MLTQWSGEQPSQGGQDCPVWPGQARPGHLATEYRNFVTQDEDRDVVGRTGAREQLEPAEAPDRDQIQQPEQHGMRSCHDHRSTPKPQVTTIVMSFGTPQGVRKGFLHAAWLTEAAMARYQTSRGVGGAVAGSGRELR